VQAESHQLNRSEALPACPAAPCGDQRLTQPTRGPPAGLSFPHLNPATGQFSSHQQYQGISP